MMGEPSSVSRLAEGVEMRDAGLCHASSDPSLQAVLSQSDPLKM